MGNMKLKKFLCRMPIGYHSSLVGTSSSGKETHNMTYIIVESLLPLPRSEDAGETLEGVLRYMTS